MRADKIRLHDHQRTTATRLNLWLDHKTPPLVNLTMAPGTGKVHLLAHCLASHLQKPEVYRVAFYSTSKVEAQQMHNTLISNLTASGMVKRKATELVTQKLLLLNPGRDIINDAQLQILYEPDSSFAGLIKTLANHGHTLIVQSQRMLDMGVEVDTLPSTPASFDPFDL